MTEFLLFSPDDVWMRSHALHDLHLLDEVDHVRVRVPLLEHLDSHELDHVFGQLIRGQHFTLFHKILLSAKEDAQNLNIVIRSVSTPVSKSHVCSNFSAKEGAKCCVLRRNW
jgi:hypothetical protein